MFCSAGICCGLGETGGVVAICSKVSRHGEAGGVLSGFGEAAGDVAGCAEPAGVAGEAGGVTCS